MSATARTVAASAVFAALAGAVVWSPAPEYLVWSRLPAVAGLGDAVLLLVAIVALALGAAFAAVTGIGPRPFAAGATLAYAVGMVALELARSPDSPVHLLLYGAVGAALTAGVVVADRSGWRVTTWTTG